MSSSVASGIPQRQGFDFDPLTQFSRLFCTFLQTVFMQFKPGMYHWDPNEKLSEITISDQATIDKKEVERRPAILVARAPAAFTNTSLNQLSGPLVGYSDVNTPSAVKMNIDPTTGNERHTDLISSTMVYNCLSKEGIEAQRLSWMTGFYTRALKKALLRGGLHRVGEEIGFGAESSPGSIVQPDPKEITMVSTSVPFYFQDSFTVGPEYKTLLKEVDLALRSEVDAPAAGATVLNPPSIYGRPVQYSELLSLDSRVVVGPWKKNLKQLKK